MSAQVDRSADGVRDPSTFGDRGSFVVTINYATDAGTTSVAMPTRVYISFALAFTDNGVTQDQVWIEAAYGIDLTPGGTYGPSLVYNYLPNSTFFGVVGDPGSHSWPSPTYILDNEFPAFVVVEGEPAGDWTVCTDRDMTSFVSAISDGVVIPDLTRNLVYSFDNAAGPGHRREWSEITDGESLTFDTIFGTVFGYRIEAFGFCVADVTPPGGDPYEPLTPPIEWDDWPEPSTTPPELPETPFVPPEDGGEWDIEHETPEDDLPQEEFEDHFESAMARWKVRLGLPDHDVIFATGAAGVDIDVLNFDFQVGSINIPITIDFDQWRPQLSLFGLMLNAAAVVWVICGVYDAVRRA